MPPVTQSPNLRLCADCNDDGALPAGKDEAALRETLKRCSPETVDAALQYHRTGDHHLVPRVVLGIIERFVERDMRARVNAANRDLRLTEDLSIDSLTLIEIVMLTEEALQITINNEELGPLKTLGDVQTFAECKARGISLPPALGNLFREPLGETQAQT
jgi:acyl carrier protein